MYTYRNNPRVNEMMAARGISRKEALQVIRNEKLRAKDEKRIASYTLVSPVASYDIPTWFHPKDIMLTTSAFEKGIVLPGRVDNPAYCYICHVYQIPFNADYFSHQNEKRFSYSVAQENMKKVKDLLSGTYPEQKYKFVTVKEVFTRIEGIGLCDLPHFLNRHEMYDITCRIMHDENYTNIKFDHSKDAKIADKIRLLY